MGLFLLIGSLLPIFATAQSPPQTPPQQNSTTNNSAPTPQRSTRGKVRIYSTKKGNDQVDRETIILWKNTVIQPHEEYDSIVVLGGNVDFHGRVQDLVIVGGQVILQDGARVENQLVVLNGNLSKKNGAVVTKQVVFELPSSFPSWIKMVGPIFSTIFAKGTGLLNILVNAIFFCLFGAILYLLCPELMRESEEVARHEPLISFGWSLIGVLSFVPGLLLLVVSIVGIVFIPLFFLFFAVIYYFSAYVMVANLIGHQLPPRESPVMPPLRLFYGVFVLILVQAVPFGNWVIFAGMIFTSGAMIHTIAMRLNKGFRKSAV